MRYEAIEVDGRHFVIDHKHPEAEPSESQYEHEAKLNARVWNLLTNPDPFVTQSIPAKREDSCDKR